MEFGGFGTHTRVWLHSLGYTVGGMNPGEGFGGITSPILGPILWTPSESLEGVQSIGPRMGLGYYLNKVCQSFVFNLVIGIVLQEQWIWTILLYSTDGWARSQRKPYILVHFKKGVTLYCNPHASSFHPKFWNDQAALNTSRMVAKLCSLCMPAFGVKCCGLGYSRLAHFV